MKSVPALEKTREAINRLDLLVSIDTMPFDTAMLADVVLPEATYLERHDALQISKGRSLTVAIRPPAIEPLYESRPGWWIAKELAKRLGVGGHFPYETYEEHLRKECSVMGVDYGALSTKGAINIPDTSAPYITPDNRPAFNTPSGKIELYSDRLKRAGFAPIPQYVRNPQPAEGEYRLIFGRSPVHTFSRTTDNEALTQMFPENVLC